MAPAPDPGLTLTGALAYARRGLGRRSRPTSGWAALTPAELEVAELAAAGLGNAEIAERLFVSVPTVKTHLRHVYGKLGVANRTELAAETRSRPDRD
jgi:DNA-binding CsgD family transcriptional regulator